MEGQAKIETDGFNIIMDKGQNNIQNNNNNLKIYILEKLFLYIY